jgi:hypothetical protein
MEREEGGDGIGNCACVCVSVCVQRRQKSKQENALRTKVKMVVEACRWGGRGRWGRGGNGAADGRGQKERPDLNEYLAASRVFSRSLLLISRSLLLLRPFRRRVRGGGLVSKDSRPPLVLVSENSIPPDLG